MISRETVDLEAVPKRDAEAGIREDLPYRYQVRRVSIT
jgi:hypothetical protein